MAPRVRPGLAAAVALSCAAPAPRGEPVVFSAAEEAGEVEEFEPVGAVSVPHGSHTSYDSSRVYMGGLSVSYGGAGEWAGHMCGRNLIARAEAGRLVGKATDLRFERRGETLVVDGKLADRPVRVEIAKGRIDYRFGSLHRRFAERVPGCFADVDLPRDECAFLLQGDAERPLEARMPQLALALLGTFCPFELLRWKDPFF